MNKPMNEAIAEFLTMQRARNVSSNTRKIYRTALADLNRHMGGDACLKQFRRRTVSGFLEHLHAKGLGAVSRRLKLAAVRTFSRWAREEGMISQDFARSVRGPRIPSRSPESPTESTIARLLDGPLPESTFEERDRVILEMLYGACGIRVAELTAVNLKDFVGKDMLKVHGKGGRERHVFFGVRARGALAKYLPLREKLLAESKVKHDALLINISPRDRCGRMDVRSVSRVFRTIADAKGMPTVTCHSLRHAFGQHTYDQGASLPVVSRLLGHARLATTAGFYVDGSIKRMMREIVHAHPHAKAAA